MRIILYLLKSSKKFRDTLDGPLKSFLMVHLLVNLMDLCLTLVHQLCKRVAIMYMTLEKPSPKKLNPGQITLEGFVDLMFAAFFYMF